MLTHTHVLILSQALLWLGELVSLGLLGEVVIVLMRSHGKEAPRWWIGRVVQAVRFVGTNRRESEDGSDQDLCL